MLGGGTDEKVGGPPENSGLKGFEGGYLKIKKDKLIIGKKVSLSLKKFNIIILLQQVKSQSINSDENCILNI